ncbi:MAG: outer rane efflux protein [Acidobacteriaceae bacterium]|nr:outer rane efflux protein [Acidobacteriaceae bacterium]
MSLSSLKCAFQHVTASLLLFAFPLSLWAQDAQTTNAQSQNSTPSQSSTQSALPQAPSTQHEFVVKDYSKAKRPFPNVIAPYTPQHVPPPDLSNTPRILQLMRDGKIYLSMDDAVALALENNLDIGIARYNLNIADTEILRSKGGANNFFGVNTGIVQNTPGGGVGGLSGNVGSGPGGTSPAAGGIGAGTNGLVSSTLGIGPTITSYDPIVSATLQSDHARIECVSPFCGPVQNTTTANFNYLQGLQSGTNINMGFTNSRVTSNNPFNFLSPSLNSGFKFQLSQHLLQGFGFLPNTRIIQITKNDREITDVAFRLQIITTIDQIENLYWNLVYAYENVRVQQEAIAFAQKTLSDTQKQVQIGSLAPIEVVRSQNTVATDQQNLVQAQTNLDLQQLLMKNALSRTLQDPQLASAEVIPTTTMALPQQEPIVPTEDLVNEALQHRAELAESRIDLSNREISEKALKNLLLPSLDLFAYYGGSGAGGRQNPVATCGSPGAFNGICSPAGSFAPTSYVTTLNKLVNSTAPDKGAGFTLSIPLRNRQAEALQVRGVLEYRQAQMRLQQIENQVSIEVRNAQFSVTQNRAAVQAAQAAVELANQSLDAEQKKFRLGASTGTNVLNYQSQLAAAKSNLVSAEAAYEKAELELDRSTGLLLEHAGIVMSDAVKGEVTHMPKIPYVAPRQDAGPAMSPQPQSQQPAPPPQ